MSQKWHRPLRNGQLHHRYLRFYTVRKMFDSVNPELRNRDETPKVHTSYHYLGCFDEVDEHVGTFLHRFFRDNSGRNPRAQLKESNKS